MSPVGQRFSSPPVHDAGTDAHGGAVEDMQHALPLDALLAIALVSRERVGPENDDGNTSSALQAVTKFLKASTNSVGGRIPFSV